MGDAQSAQRDGKKDAAAEEESGRGDDAQTEQNIEDKPSIKNGQIPEINGKADDSIAEVKGQCEDDVAAEAILSPDQHVLETETPLKEEETPLENVEINVKESANEANADEDVPLEIMEIDAKQNDINAGYRRFFSNIGLKLTVRRGSGGMPTDVPDETNREEPNRPEDVEDTAKETKSENAEQNTDLNTAQETYDNDSTTCPTLTDVTPEDTLENAEEKTTETKEKVTSPVGEDAHQKKTPEEEPQSTSPSSPEEEVVISPIKRFFTTGIFSGLRKKKKPTEDETTEKELVNMVKKEVGETTKQTVQDQQQDKDEISQGVEAAAVQTEHKENGLKEEIMPAASTQTTDEEKSPATDPSTLIVSEPEILSSQEKEKVQASPLRRLLSGSSLKKFSKKQRGSKSGDAKLSDSGEHVSDQLLSSTEPAENQKEDGPAQPSAEAAAEEDGAWASFKKLVTPKKHMKRSSMSNDETQIPGSAEEPKPSEGEQISDHSTEEGKKRKDSSVSWEAVLCGSGRRRSRKTSDSEDETPHIDKNDNKEDSGSKHDTGLQLESSNENGNDILASSPKQTGSPSGTDGESTWKSLKKLVTPKRKAKDEDESKDNIQSDSEVSQEESFSIKKLLPGRKKRKSAEKPDQVSSDEADKDVPSGDEDSETPAVVPLSEFDTDDTEVHIHSQADIESHIPEEEDYELQQELLDQVAEPVPPCDNLQTEAKKVEDDDDVLKKQATSTPTSNVEPEDLTEIISKHHQLSDIPEEGIITETVATPASVTEEAARDDTIAEDLIEITSEAITAPEPVDITLTDETEMISAVSQLSSESSKTSGNTTPVPAEYDVKDTDALLQHVTETISISPTAVQVCSDKQSSETIVGSVSPQILETFVKEEPLLEEHRRLDPTAINKGLNVEELDAIHVLGAAAQTESTSEGNDSDCTETVSEVPTDEFDGAEIAVDEVHEVNVTHPEESVKDSDSFDMSHHVVESLSGVSAAVSTDILPEGEEIVQEEVSLFEAHGNETEPQSIHSQEAHLTATVVDETKDGAIEQDVQTEKEDRITNNITDSIQSEDKDQLQEEVELQELAAVQVPTPDSKEGSVRSLEKDTVTCELKEKSIPITEVNVLPEKEDELEMNAAKTVQAPDESEAVQASTLASAKVSVQSPEEEVKSEDIAPAETVSDEPKQKAEELTEVSVEPENTELPVKAVETDHVQEHGPITEVSVEPEKEDEHEMNAAETVQAPEVLEAFQAATLGSEDSVQSLEKEVISEDVPEAETVTDEPKEETMPLTEVNLEPVDASKTDHVQESEVLQALQASTLNSEAGSVRSLEKVISEDISAVETVTDEPKQETEENVEQEEELPEKDAKTEHIEKPEVLPPDVTESKTEEDESMHVHEIPECIEEGGAQELEKQIMLEDIPKPDTDTVIASVTGEIESKVVAQLHQTLEIREDQKKESIPEDVEVEQEDHTLEVINELHTLTAVHLSSVNEESDNVQVRETIVSYKETPAPCVDNAAVTEPKHEVHLSAVQVNVEGETESELPGSEMKTAAVEHAVVAQVVTCNLKEVSVAVPDVLTEKTSHVHEPLIDRVASEVVFKEANETATPLVRDDVPETAEEGSVVVMTHVPSVQFEDNHRIQVQVVDVDIRSAEAIVDTVLEVGVTEDKEVIDVSHETVKKVENLIASPEIELMIEENKLIIQEVIQHVKDNLPETAPESVAVNLEPEVMKQPDVVTDVSELLESDSNEVSDQKAMEDSSETFNDKHDEAPAVISDATKQQVSEDLTPTPDMTESLKVSIHDHKEDLEETKAEREKSEADVTAEEVKLSSEELNVKTISEQAQITATAQSQIVTSSDTGLVVPQNIGVISSVGNVESPSSLSLEFKLNIQFGQAKAPESPSPTTERIERVEHMDKAEVGVQAEEAEEPVIKPINPTQSAESQKQTQLTEVAVQATGTTEPAANFSTDSTERAVIMSRPTLLNVGTQAIETAKIVEEIKSTERATSNVKATETIQPERQTEKREVFLGHPGLPEEFDQDSKAEEPVKQTEAEGDQDVWTDAEEVIQTQEGAPAEEPPEEREDKAGLDHDVEIASNTEGEESQQDMCKMGGARQTESEGEDFAIALEHPEIATASTTTMELD